MSSYKCVSMVMMVRYNRAFFLLLVVALTLGCMDDSTPVSHTVKTVPAQGVLLFSGKPLAFYQVTCWPEDDRPAIGVTDENGHFILGTNRPGDGAVEGLHRISVIEVGDPSDDPLAMGVAEVGATSTTKKKPEVVIHIKYHKPETSGLTVEIPPGGDLEMKIDLQ